MAKIRTEAKTTSVAVARVLRSLGLKAGTDFKVRTGRRGTSVVLTNDIVRRTVVDHADYIESAVEADGGWHIHVGITYEGSTAVPSVANFGGRVREAAPKPYVSARFTA